jgi:hypothetical protein
MSSIDYPSTPAVIGLAGPGPSLLLQAVDRHSSPRRSLPEPATGMLVDAVLSELAAEADQLPVEKGPGTTGARAQSRSGEAEGPTGLDEVLFQDPRLAPDSTNLMSLGTGLQPAFKIPMGKMPVPQADPMRQSGRATLRLVDLVLAAGFSSYGAGILTAMRPGARGPRPRGRWGRFRRFEQNLV